jgi:WD40 repeat protein
VVACLPATPLTAGVPVPIPLPVDTFCSYHLAPCPPPLLPPHTHLQATGSFDETVRFWDVRSGRVLREVPAHSDPVSGLDWSPDGTGLASASFDGLVRLWDAGTGHCLKSLSCDRTSTALSGVLFTPNGGCGGEGTPRKGSWRGVCVCVCEAGCHISCASCVSDLTSTVLLVAAGSRGGVPP